jgi:hypothetical protein
MTINKKLMSDILNENRKSRETIWSTLNDTTGSILEHVDITKQNLEIIVGEKFITRLHEGMVTEKVAEEILWYQDTEEGCDSKGRKYYSASRDGNKIMIKFLRTAF